MSREKTQVRRFYEEIWNQRAKEPIPEILADDFAFRGSLGVTTTGRAGFVEYLDMVHAALGNYHCSINELVAEGSKVFAKMAFSGTHRGELLGYAATGKQVTWEGTALFHFSGDLITSLWVLGDIKRLEAQLADGKT